MARLILLSGGVRSGKSALALEVASKLHPQRAFIATAEPIDGEMSLRITRHQAERGPSYATIEEPLEIGAALSRAASGAGVAVVDCLTVWLGNVYHRESSNEEAVARRIDGLVEALRGSPLDVVVVTNEVGWGIVPADALSRSYRDSAGRLNRLVAGVSDTVCLVVCGLPLTLKGSLP